MRSIIPILAVESQTEQALGANRDENAVKKLHGVFNTIEMRFARRPSAVPFRMAVIQEVPDGSGPELEASIWLAAAVAALQRSDDLAGVAVSLSVKGEVDGPSAGGVVCLALLSALDGKELPRDFAFTGSILPDGTIGHVGGLVEKITAAKADGVKRVLLPAGIRFEEDLNTEKLVDLKELATSLGLEFVPVRNVEEAYRVVHGAAPQRLVPISGAILELSPALEKTLIADYRRQIEAGDAIWSAIPEEEQAQMLADPHLGELLASRIRAERAFRSGQFFYARDQSSEWSFFMQAGDETRRFFESVAKKENVLGFPAVDPAKDPQKFFSALELKIKQTFDATLQPKAVVKGLSEKLPPIASQFCIDADEFHSLRQLSEQLDAALLQAAREIVEAEDSDLPEGADRQELLFQTVLEGKSIQLLLAHLGRNCQREYAADTVRLSKDLPNVKLNSARARRVEQFFHTAYRSVYQTLESSVIRQVAEDADVSVAQARQLVASVDMSLTLHLPKYGAAIEAHRLLSQRPDDDPAKDFLAAMYAQMFAVYIADVSSIIVRWTELDAEITDDGEINYRRLDLLSHMLREARENAILKISECHRSGVPCPAAIWWFQSAEAMRDDNSSDKVEVLANYWRASLQAQALRMLFEEEG